MQPAQTGGPIIVVPIDGSALAEAAIPVAAALGGSGATLRLLRVIPAAESIKGLWGGVVASEAQVQEMTEAEANGDLERAQGVPVPEGTTVAGEFVTGDPADQIIQAGVRHGADLIVMASHGRGAVGRWTFGSVADRVARESLVPVTIVCPPVDGGAMRPTVERIVVPLDGSDLSHRAIPVARDLARRLAAPIQLLQVINPSTGYYPILAAGAIAAEDQYEHEFANEELEAERNLNAAAAELRDAGIEATVRIQVGPVIPAIEAALQPGDVVVITSHGRGGIRRWLLGSVAERLIRAGLAPVVLVPATERQRVRAAQPALEPVTSKIPAGAPAD